MTNPTRNLTLAAIFALVAAPALAGQCPADIAAINAALSAGTSLSDAQVAEVEALRDEGQRLHGAGEHRNSVETLARAKDMLGLS